MITAIRILALSALLASVLAACVDVTNPDKLKDTQTDDLCKMYYFAGQKTTAAFGVPWPDKKADIKEELDNRAAIAPNEWPLIDAGRLQPGMSECALEAAWGHPLRIDHASTAAGDSTRYVYSLERNAYLVNGRVTGFQY